MHIGVIANTEYAGIEEVLQRLGVIAERRALRLFYSSEVEQLVDADGPRLEDAWGDVDVILTLGGDGTLLRAAGLAAPRDVPVLGCNMGRLGFLTAMPLEELDAAIGRFISGDYFEERRRGVQVQVERADSTAAPVPDSYGLNDAVIHKSGYARLIALRVWVDEEEIGQYSADGIIISTATGSTAYSLSAGGPILVPGLDALVATPICPHTLAVRPVVIPSTAVVRVEVLSREAEMVLTVDGRGGGRLNTGDRVITRAAEHPVRLIRFPGQSFFSVLRHKLRWGDVRPTDEPPSRDS